MEKKIEMKRKHCSTKSDVHNSHTITEPVKTLHPVVHVEDYMRNSSVVEKSVSELPHSKTQKLDHVQNSCDENRCDLSSSPPPATVDHESEQCKGVVDNSSDQVDHELEDEVPIKVSSAQDKELRRIARLKQLERMKAIEAATSRQQRYNKRVNSTNPMKVSSKKVKWKKDLSVYHIYNDDSS